MKLDKPRFWKLSMFTVIVSIGSFVALFSFWNDLDDLCRLAFVFCIFVILLVINTCVYCYDVNKFYVEYEKLYENNKALSDNYCRNQMLLKQEEYNNSTLRDIVRTTLSLLVVYNDVSEERRLEIKNEIANSFINSLNGGEEYENEKEI